MVTFRLLPHAPGGLLAGATLGALHHRLLLDALPTDTTTTTTVVVDFDGIVGATGSYLKAFIVSILVDRQAALESKPARSESYARVDLLLEHVSEDVATDLRGALVDAGLACLERLEWTDTLVVRARCHGQVEPAIRDALATLLGARSATAAELGGADKRVGVTAWHYRLGTLLKLGLARRSKSERSWVYEPAAAEVIYG